MTKILIEVKVSESVQYVIDALIDKCHDVDVLSVTPVVEDNDTECDYDSIGKAYDRGLRKGWNLFSKLYSMHSSLRAKIFGTSNLTILSSRAPSCIIADMKQYEEIHVGDKVRTKSDNLGVVLSLNNGLACVLYKPKDDHSSPYRTGVYAVSTLIKTHRKETDLTDMLEQLNTKLEDEDEEGSDE